MGTARTRGKAQARACARLAADGFIAVMALVGAGCGGGQHPDAATAADAVDLSASDAIPERYALDGATDHARDDDGGRAADIPAGNDAFASVDASVADGPFGNSAGRGDA